MVHSFPKVNVETRPGYLLFFFKQNCVERDKIKRGDWEFIWIAPCRVHSSKCRKLMKVSVLFVQNYRKCLIGPNSVTLSCRRVVSPCLRHLAFLLSIPELSANIHPFMTDLFDEWSILRLL